MDENEDNIRPPDPIIQERLFDDERSDFDKEIEQAIKLSMESLRDQELMNISYEEEVLKTYQKVTLERKEQCREILLDMSRLTRYDKEIKEIYDIVEPILEYYCAQNIDFYDLDELTYHKIFNVLSKMRTNQKNIEFLKTVIRC